MTRFLPVFFALLIVSAPVQAQMAAAPIRVQGSVGGVEVGGGTLEPVENPTGLISDYFDLQNGYPAAWGDLRSLRDDSVARTERRRGDGRAADRAPGVQPDLSTGQVPRESLDVKVPVPGAGRRRSVKVPERTTRSRVPVLLGKSDRVRDAAGPGPVASPSVALEGKAAAMGIFFDGASVQGALKSPAAGAAPRTLTRPPSLHFSGEDSEIKATLDSRRKRAKQADTPAGSAAEPPGSAAVRPQVRNSQDFAQVPMPGGPSLASGGVSRGKSEASPRTLSRASGAESQAPAGSLFDAVFGGAGAAAATGIGAAVSAVRSFGPLLYHGNRAILGASGVSPQRRLAASTAFTAGAIFAVGASPIAGFFRGLERGFAVGRRDGTTAALQSARLDVRALSAELAAGAAALRAEDRTSKLGLVSFTPEASAGSAWGISRILVRPRALLDGGTRVDRFHLIVALPLFLIGAAAVLGATGPPAAAFGTLAALSGIAVLIAGLTF